MSKPSMAEQLKKNLSRRNLSFKSITAIVLFGLIIVVFVLFGYSSRMGGGGIGAAAQVNNAYISMADVQQKSQELERMYAGMFGGNFGDAQRQYLLQSALESLIQNELMSQYAEKNGIYATDREIQDIITKEVPYFQENGSFRFDRYRSILEANRMQPADYEAKIRAERKTQRLRHLFEVSSIPLSAEIDQLKELEETQMNFQFVKIERAKVIDTLSVTPKEIQEKLANAEFKKKVEEDFKANIKAYEQDEQVRAQHILINVEKGSKDSEASALKKIQAIKLRAAKEDFGKLAAELSEDRGSKASKGDVGFFSRGRMVPEFDQAAFTQAIGVVGEPIKSQFGYHLIKVTEKKAAAKAELKNVEDKIAKRIIAEEKFEAESKKLEDAMAANNMVEVEKSLKSIGANWQETGFVNIGMDQIPALSSAMATQAAFELSSAKPISKIVRDGGMRFILKYKDRSQKPAAKPVVADAMAKERGYDRMGQWVGALQKEAHIERNLHGEKGSVFDGPPM